MFERDRQARVAFARDLYTSVVEAEHIRRRGDGKGNEVAEDDPQIDEATWAAVPQQLRAGVKARMKAIQAIAATDNFGAAREEAHDASRALADALPERWEPPVLPGPAELAAKVDPETSSGWRGWRR